MVGHVRRNVVSYLALFVALTGTSYAALKLPNGSVGSAQLRSGAVTGSKLAAGAVTSDKVKRGSLLPSDFKPGSLPTGPSGSPGPKGDQGSPGLAGQPGLGASAFSDDAAGTPVGPITLIVKQVPIDTQRAGKLVVVDATLESGTIANSSSTPSTYVAGVYVDGVGVPGTAYACQATCSAPPMTNTVLQSFSVRGSISNVPAGSHTVTLALTQLSGDQSNNLVNQQGRLLVIATG